MGEKTYTGPERRKYTRFERKYFVRCRKIKEKGEEPQEGLIIFKKVGKVFQGKTHDISIGGICLIASTQLPLNSTLSLEIFASTRKEPFKAIGEVVWRKKISEGHRYTAGIQFIHIDEREQFQALLEKSESITRGLKKVKLK